MIYRSPTDIPQKFFWGMSWPKALKREIIIPKNENLKSNKAWIFKVA